MTALYWTFLGGGATGGQKFHWGPPPAPLPLEPPLFGVKEWVMDAESGDDNKGGLSLTSEYFELQKYNFNLYYDFRSDLY